MDRKYDELGFWEVERKYIAAENVKKKLAFNLVVKSHVITNQSPLTPSGSQVKELQKQLHEIYRKEIY